MDKTEEKSTLDFENYDEYLDSFVSKDDIRYLGSVISARMLAGLGYGSTSNILTRQQFETRKAIAMAEGIPMKRHYALASKGVTVIDPFLSELALRERSNRLRILSTIIFIRDITRSGFEVSGYIDYEQSLRRSSSRVEDAVDWNAIFRQKKRLWPQRTDLSYYHWRSGLATYNNTDNYRVVSDAQKGLVFIYKGDRKMICVDPFIENPGSYTTRTVMFSEKYNNVILYDHVIRSKI